MNNIKGKLIVLLLLLLSTVCATKAQPPGAAIIYLDSVRKSRSLLSNKGPTLLNDFQKKYIPTPDAYSLMQYSEIPVSLYTGVPDISIPLYTIEVGDFKLPIYLSYHASGIKIAQESSRVGLGWSLHAGGEISRLVRGFDDFWGNESHDGFYFSKTPIEKEYQEPFTLIHDLSTNSYLWADRHYGDGEPDIFHYNFGNYSGQFYPIRGAGRSSLTEKFFLSKPEDLLHIEYDEKYNGITVTTAENLKYYFSKTNRMWSTGFVYSSYYLYWYPEKDDFFPHGGKYSFFNPINQLGISEPNPAITTWFLTRIETPSGEFIDFEYEYKTDYYFSPYFESWKMNKIIPIDGSHDYDQYTFFVGEPQQDELIKRHGPQDEWVYNGQIALEDWVLKRIKWKNGHVDFVEGTEDRKDVRIYNKSSGIGPTYGMKPLSSIKVFSNKRTKPLYTYDFHQSYFWSEPRKKDGIKDVRTSTYSYLSARLKLDSISMKGTGNDVKKYKMGYDQSSTLPLKNSGYCDRWGYYSGADRENWFESYIPKHNYYRYDWGGKDGKELVVFQSRKWLQMGDTVRYNDYQRYESNTPSDFAKTWTLNSLTSPTDGKTDFRYEVNRIYSENKAWINETKFKEIGFTKPMYDAKGLCIQKDTTIDIPPFSGYVTFECIYEGNSKSTNLLLAKVSIPSFMQYGLRSGRKEDIGGSRTKYTFTKRMSYQSSTSQKSRIVLTQSSDDEAKISMHMNFFHAEEVDTPEVVGGIRIAEIKSPITTKRYHYIYGTNSSGLLLRKPMYATPFMHMVYFWGISNPVAMFDGVQYSTIPFQPMANPVNGTHIGYSFVQVETLGSGQQLWDDYSFYNVMERPFKNPYDMGITLPLNGKMQSHISFVGDKVVLRETFVYDTTRIHTERACNGYGESLENYVYSLNSYHTFLKKKTTKEKGSDLWRSGETVTTYQYNPKNYYPYIIETAIEGMPKEKTYTSFMMDYPFVYPDAKLLTQPVEKVVYKDNVPIFRYIYQNNGSTKVQPYKEYAIDLTGDNYPAFFTDVVKYNTGKYIPEITFTSYDSKNRNTSFEAKDGRKGVIVWGYNHQYPIAYILNANPELLKGYGVNFNSIADKDEPSAEDWNLLYSLQKRLSSDIEVTICEYEPLVGMTKQTAPTGKVTRYVYDGFGRLKETIEETEEGENVVNEYDYKYATEKK